MIEELLEKTYTFSAESFYCLLEKDLIDNKKRFVVTANLETFSKSINDVELRTTLFDKATTIIADGIGIVKGAEKIGIKIMERIPGVELTERMLYLANKHKQKIYLFGAKPKVLELLVKKIEQNYLEIDIVGFENGYIDNIDEQMKIISELKPDIVLVALGVPRQEILIHNNLYLFNKGIFIGVGGSFDVISGVKKRAPVFMLKHNLEWFYRIAKEPKRIPKFLRGAFKFLKNLKK